MRPRVYVAVFVGLLGLLSLTAWYAGLPKALEEAPSATEIRERISIIDRVNPKAIKFRWSITQDFLQKEDLRFRHIDAKANTFLGLLALAVTVVASVGGLMLGQESVRSSPQYFRAMLSGLWIGTAILLAVSFFFSLRATRVITNPGEGGYYAIPPEAVIGSTRIVLDRPSFEKKMIEEGWEVLFKNIPENNRKAWNLAWAQTIANYAAVTLVGIVVLLGLVLVTGPPLAWKQSRSTCRARVED